MTTKTKNKKLILPNKNFYCLSNKEKYESNIYDLYESKNNKY